MNTIIVDPSVDECRIYSDEWLSILKKNQDMTSCEFINKCCKTIKLIAEENNCRVLIDKCGCGMSYYAQLKYGTSLDVEPLKFKQLWR